MLSLPRRLLFGDQSKLDFKLDTVNGFARLYAERHIPYHDSRYWSSFLQFDSPTDIYDLLSLAHLRRARTNAPENLVTLVRVLVAHLESLLIDPAFSPPPTNLAAASASASSTYLPSLSGWSIPGLSSSAHEQQQDSRDRARETLNVVRILTRTLPAVLEHTEPALEQQVLWTVAPGPYSDVEQSQPAKGVQSSAASSNEKGAAQTESQFVIDDEDDGDESTEPQATSSKPDDPLQAAAAADADQPAKAKGDTDDDDDVPPALGERLIRLTIDLLFCSGFTIPWTEEQLADAAPTRPPKKVHYAIWESGVGSSVDLPGTTKQHVSNRNEVLRLLLVLISKTIYVPADKQQISADPALRFVAQELERGLLLPLMCSLLNTSIANARNSVSAWLGLPKVGGIVGGGGGAGTSAEEAQASLVSQSVQVLDVLLNYEPPQPGEVDTVSLSTLGPPQPGPGGKNVFRFYMSKLHREADFDFIWRGMAKSLGEHVSSPIQILAIQIPTGQSRRAAGSSWHISQVPERLMLLWRLLELNSKFRAYVLDSPQRAPALLSFLLYFSLTYKDNLALQGLVRLCAFMLQDISADKSFGVQIAKAGSGSRLQLPYSRFGMAASSTAVDTLVQGIYSLIASTKGELASLYPTLVIALANTAPHWRALSITASTRLIHLLRSFSQPAFLLCDENNPRLLFYVLDALNSCFALQYAANPNLVYAFVLAHKIISSLESFSLRRGVEEVWKKRRALGTDTRDWFEGAERLEKAPLPPPLPDSETMKAEDADQGGEGRRATAAEKGKARRISTSSNSPAEAGASGPPTLPAGWDGELSKYSDEAVEIAARRYIGKNGFAPTQAWVESWHSGLPLHPLRLVIDRLLPEIERIAGANGAVTTPSTPGSGTPTLAPTPTPPTGGGGNVDEKVLSFIRRQDMEGYLPPPPNGIHARPWTWTPYATIWLRSYLWGTIYVSSLLPFGVWADTAVRLFKIHERADPSATSATSPAPAVPASTRAGTTGAAAGSEPSSSLQPSGGGEAAGSAEEATTKVEAA